METLEGATLLASFIQYCWGQHGEPKKAYILQTLVHAKIEQSVFELAQLSFNQLNQPKLKMYLFCLRNMALCDM